MIAGLSESDEKKIISVIQKFPDIRSALVFGSRAMGNHKTGSDIDIAFKGRLGTDTLARIRSEFESLPLPYFFDVLDYDTITEPALKDHIDAHGRIFYQSSGQ